MSEIILTAKEANLLRDIVMHNEYGERGNMDNTPWSWAVCGTKAKGAVLGSLVQKGLAKQNGSGKEASCHLTEAGKVAYLQKFGANDINPSTFPAAAPKGLPSKADILGDIFS